MNDETNLTPGESAPASGATAPGGESAPAAVAAPPAAPAATLTEALAAESAPGIDPAQLDPTSWYIIHTYSGHEQKVKHSIDNRVTALGLQGRIHYVLVPMEKVEEVKRGRKVLVEKRMYPGYILINMAPEIELWNLIHKLPGVSGFIGAGGLPTRMQPSEVKLIFDQMFGRQRRPRLKVAYDLGENVRIVVGPFTDFTGKIQEIDEARGKLKLVVDIFGRATPVEVEIERVEKL